LIKPVPAEKPRPSSLSSTEDQEVLEMIDTSSDKKPQPASKPQPMSLRRKVLSQIQEEEEEEDERLKLNSDEEDVDPREESKEAPKKQKLTKEQASALGVEANKRKREAKAADKEERKQKDSQNLSRSYSHVAALMEDLNKAAEQGLKKVPQADKEGKPAKPYFFKRHIEGDMDCLGDLKYLTRKDIQKAMKFYEDELLFASKL
jgi:hypothetical protein